MPCLSGGLSPEQRAALVLHVDVAGEYGAKQTAEDHLTMLGETLTGSIAREMAQGDDRHLSSFAEDFARREVRAVVLLPLWHVAGYALVAATALLGREGAMACTKAVEEVIDGHYARQERAIGSEEPELGEKIREVRADEHGHRDTPRVEGAAAAPGYRVIRCRVRASTRLAIRLSERV